MRASHLSVRWLVVAALSLTTTAGYGILGYAFSVFMVPMQHELGVGRAAIAGAQAVQLCAGALGAVAAGRWLDRRGSRSFMLIGAVASTAAVFAWSRVESLLELYLVCAAIGLAGAAVLYEAAFAVVVQWFEPERRGTAILAITIVGGLASTIFLPLCGVLLEAYGWRGALVVLTVVYGAVSLPLHAFVRSPRDGEQPVTTAREVVTDRVARQQVLRSVWRDRAYWLLAVAFVFEGGAVAVVSLHLVAYLVELGHRPAFAATIAGLLGLLSVTGRLVTTVLQRRASVTVVVAVIFGVQAVGAAALPLLGGSAVGAVLCIVAFGIGMGVSTIARPVMLADRYDLHVYATVAGSMAGMMLGMKAVAPFGAALLYGISGGYGTVLVCCAAACLVGMGGLLLVGRTDRGDSRRSGQRRSREEEVTT